MNYNSLYEFWMDESPEKRKIAMFKTGTNKVVFSFEPTDRGVGIMSEDFSIWEEDGDCWCNLADIAAKTFVWYDNETGNEVPRPMRANTLEALLLTYAESFYDQEY